MWNWVRISRYLGLDAVIGRLCGRVFARWDLPNMFYTCCWHEKVRTHPVASEEGGDKLLPYRELTVGRCIGVHRRALLGV